MLIVILWFVVEWRGVEKILVIGELVMQFEACGGASKSKHSTRQL